MGWFSDVFGGLLGRDPPALPGPAEERRADSAGGGSVMNPLTGLGSWADKGASARPNPCVVPLRDDELRALYGHNGLARRIVDLPPGRATRRGWTVTDIPQSEDKRLRTWERHREGWSMADLYGGAVLLMVTEDDVPRSARGMSPSAWLMQPLDLRRIGVLHAIHVFDAFEASPASWENDIASPGWRLPGSWSLSSSTGWSATVHASRVVHLRGRRRPPSEIRGWVSSNAMPDDSVLQVLWDEIQRLSQTMAGGATAAHELRESVLKMHGLSQALAGDQAKLWELRFKLMARLRSMLGMHVIDAQDDYQSRSTTPAGFKDLSEAAQAMLATALGWPRSMLSGEPPGGLSTDDKSGRERERQIVSDYQEQRREGLESLYRVVYAAQDGPVRGREPAEWELKFAALDEPTEAETAALRLQVAQTDKIYVEIGALPPEAITEGRFGEDGWAMDLPAVEPPDPDDDAAIERARQLLERAGEGGGDDSEDPRADAGPRSCLVWVPAADPGLADQVARAIGQSLEVERSPHVTVLFMGDLVEGAEPEVVAAVAEVAAGWRPSTLEHGAVRAFTFGMGGVPIVVEFDVAWSLEELNGALLRRLAHLTTARQHPRYRAHLTIGYASQPLSAEAIAALSQVDASEARVSAAALVVSVGGTAIATIPFGA